MKIKVLFWIATRSREESFEVLKEVYHYHNLTHLTQIWVRSQAEKIITVVCDLSEKLSKFTKWQLSLLKKATLWVKFIENWCPHKMIDIFFYNFLPFLSSLNIQESILYEFLLVELYSNMNPVLVRVWSDWKWKKSWLLEDFWLGGRESPQYGFPSMGDEIESPS